MPSGASKFHYPSSPISFSLCVEDSPDFKINPDRPGFPQIPHVSERINVKVCVLVCSRVTRMIISIKPARLVILILATPNETLFHCPTPPSSFIFFFLSHWDRTGERKPPTEHGYVCATPRPLVKPLGLGRELYRTESNSPQGRAECDTMILQLVGPLPSHSPPFAAS
ncbi:hypothetical protein RRG08_055752 [Elysia crispata]|uniref:Uncharacterized protein n=1 Tax=Elysia crispata TaxID=231223 RepID=A0AAE1AAC1_9GAST|nr:hypothetical protein RRG08_055752 [Elysia crispata]